MIPLAYLISELDRGGAELSLLRLARGLKGTPFEPVVYSLAGCGPVGGLIEAEGIKVVSLRLPDRPFAGIVELVAGLRAARPSILHSFLFHANLVGRLAGRLVGVPHVISSVRVCEVDRPWRAAVDRLTQSCVDVEICVAEAVRTYTRRAAGIAPEKLVVIRNGVEAGATAPPRSPAGHRALTVAHLRAQKGVGDLVEAARRVRSAVPDATFTVVGRGDVDAYRRCAQSMGVDGAVRFVGEVPDVASYLAEADLFVLPSWWEGLPNAVLEAMAAGLPVVATAVGGAQEPIVDGVTGRLVPPHAPEALARAVVEVMTDPARARAMGAAGRARAAAEFSVDRMVREHLDLYARCLSGDLQIALAPSQR